jgi:ATP-dependent Clp protease ATP-binding subunit ClpC
MSTQTLKQPIAFMTCANCSGTGKLRTLVCPVCSGFGVGAFQGDNFLYFNVKLTEAIIRGKHVSKVGKKIEKTLAIIVCSLGLASLAWWLLSVGEIVQAFATGSAELFTNLQFWNFQHPLLLFFWISNIPALYIVYQLMQERDGEHFIQPLAYNQSLPYVNDVPWEELKKLHTKKINVFFGIDTETENVLDQAFLLARKFGHNHITSLHMFAVALFCSQKVTAVITRLTISETKLMEGIERQLLAMDKSPYEPFFEREAKEILIEAYATAARNGQKKISPLDLLVPCFDHNPRLAELLYDLETDRTKLTNTVLWVQFSNRLAENYNLYKKMASFKPSSNMDRAYTALETPLLDRFSYDWTLAAKWGRVDLCVERDEEIRKIFDVVEKGQYGMLLVGPFGVGKNSVIGGVAQRMVLENVPTQFQDKRLIEIDIAHLLGGLTPDAAEQRLLQIIVEVARARNIILYIKDIEKIMGITSGQEGSLDMASVLSDAISRGLVYCLASVTDENYQKYIEKSLLGSLMTKVEIKEPDINTAIRMVESKVPLIESKYGIYFSYNSLAEVVNLTARYMHDTYLPGKAISVLESVAVVASRKENKTVDREAIASVITELTHIPVTKLTQDESQSLLNLEEKIHERVIGQDEAVKMVSSALRRARVELRESKRPIANFLFLGPTGVGKTELAKAVSEVYFGREDYMIRVDMSEYQNSDSVNKMIGSPEGVAGYLTEAVRKMPFSLILLDEVEKAHPDILNLFLQVMDDGRLTDGQGKTIDFTNSIIIATSNVGSVLIQQTVREGGNFDSLKEQLINTELVKAMRPELINRFDGVIIFKPLNEDSMIEITKLLVAKVKQRIESKGYLFSVSDAVIKQLAALGFNPEFGARPLRRLLQEKIDDSIATKLLEGGVERRDTIIVNDDLSVSVTKAERI